MDESHFYPILETYKKQEPLLAEKQEQLNKYISEYQNELKRMETLQKEEADQISKLNGENRRLFGNIQTVSRICMKRDSICKKEKQKHNKLCESKIKIRTTTENQTEKLQETLKVLKQLDTEHQTENISTKIENYRNKIKNGCEIVAEKCEEYQNLIGTVQTSDYQIPSDVKEKYKSKNFTESLVAINAEIEKVKKNIQNAKI